MPVITQLLPHFITIEPPARDLTESRGSVTVE